MNVCKSMLIHMESSEFGSDTDTANLLGFRLHVGRCVSLCAQTVPVGKESLLSNFGSRVPLEISALAEVGWNQVVLAFLASSLTESAPDFKEGSRYIFISADFLFDSNRLKSWQLHSGMLMPEPPISFGRSFIFGSPSCIRSFVSS